MSIYLDYVANCLYLGRGSRHSFRSQKIPRVRSTVRPEGLIMDTPRFREYQFSELIADNALWQSWLAVNLRTAKKCFVKIPKDNHTVGIEGINSIFARSYAAQGLIRSRRILTAREKHRENGKLLIEYAYLSPKLWKPLSPWDLLCDDNKLLVEICILADYLHSLDLVHCDLKLSNFLVRNTGKTPNVLLADIDFLCKCGTNPNAKILGSPGHIAPELATNDRILVQSDNYSLGISINNATMDLLESGHSKDANIEQVQNFANAITHPDPIQRPKYLLAALRKYEVIDDEELHHAEKTALGLCLRTFWPPNPPTKKYWLRDILTNARLLGPSWELLEETEAAYEKSRTRCRAVLGRLLQDGTPVRYGDYWHLSIPESTLQSAYHELEERTNGRSEPGSETTNAGSIQSQVDKATRLKDDGFPEKSYFLFCQIQREIECHEDQSDSGLAERTLQSLAELTTARGLYSESIKYYSRLLESQNSQSEAYLKTLYEIAWLDAILGRTQQMTELMGEGDDLSLKTDRVWHQLQFQRLRAWLLGLQGEHQRAELLLRETLDAAQSHTLDDIVARVHHDLSTLYWRGGQFKQAKNHITTGLALSKKQGYNAQAVSLLSALSALHFELAEYKDAIIVGKQCVRLAIEPIHVAELISVSYRIAESNARLGEHKKADYWIQRAWDQSSHITDPGAIVLHYLAEGYTGLMAGKLSEANESLLTALELTTSHTPASITGHILRGLAELAAWQGRQKDCEHYLSDARTVFSAVGVKTSLAQVELATELYANPEGGELSVKRLCEHFETLISLRCHYDAVRCLFHMLILSEPGSYSELMELSAPLHSVISNSGVPLFRATDLLLRVEDPSTASDWISALKLAYQILAGARQSFPAMIVCRKIGQHYVNSQKNKLARKFLRRALVYAEALGNSICSDQIEAELDAVAADENSEHRLIDSLHSISELLPNMDDRDACLKRLVDFAVEETGAERGVLLLRHEDSDLQNVVAFVNCDDESLVDIKDFSMSIPVHVAKNGLPLIVENALEDKRTKSYKSVVCHNIQSVICTPIVRDNTVVGTLYLDHHTIPALFEKIDVKYVSAIANFVGSALSSIQYVRDVNIMNRELARDVDRLVGTKEFITQSPILQAMFSKLPVIARSTASVLIQGESGTGKEILCKMLHDMSARSKKPLVKLNSSAMATTMIESELFGVAKDAATGVREREGRFEAADGSTLFLDEIGDMPLDLQAAVLRVIEYGEFQRVGSNRSRYADVRIICATNKDLSQLVESKRFREDLYYRINTIVLDIPPLRSRRCDIPLLIEHFGRVFGDGDPPTFTAEAMRLITEYYWPGNVRQLKNFVEHHCILHAGKRVGPQALPKELLHDAKLAGTLDQATEMTLLRNALIEHNWNQAQAAHSVPIPLTTFRRKIKKYGIRKS